MYHDLKVSPDSVPDLQKKIKGRLHKRDVLELGEKFLFTPTN